MVLAPQTIALLQAARQVACALPADAILLLTETDLDWQTVLEHLNGCRLLVAAEDGELSGQLKNRADLTVLEIDPGPTPTQERMSLALLEAVRSEHLRQGADVVVLYNGIEVSRDVPEQIDSMSVIHLGEHLERLSARELRKLDTQVPLETLRAVVDLAVAVGREGREGHRVGTMFVVGDTRKVLTMCRAMNFNPFRGYSAQERDIRNRSVREQIKDIAQLEGAIVVRRDGVAVAACMRIEAPDKGLSISKGLGTRHAAAAAISKSTKAIAIAVSQSSGSVRLYQGGEMVLHIEPLARLTWGSFHMEGQDGTGINRPANGPARLPGRTEMGPREGGVSSSGRATPERS
jgi:DNA integrity scanning protein DisA with diadenylate cyclase activity